MSSYFSFRTSDIVVGFVVVILAVISLTVGICYLFWG